MNKLYGQLLLIVLFLIFSVNRCNESAEQSDSSPPFTEPKTNFDWKEFCEAPQLKERLKVITNKQKRQEFAVICRSEPWKNLDLGT